MKKMFFILSPYKILSLQITKFKNNVNEKVTD